MDITKKELEQFIETYHRIEEQIELVSRIMGCGLGSDFDGLLHLYGEKEITYSASTYYNGCGRECESVSLKFDELIQPEEYWVARKQEVDAEKLRKAEASKKRKEEEETERKRQEYLKLKEEFGE
jgi:hypothetical protein